MGDSLSDIIASSSIGYVITDFEKFLTDDNRSEVM